MRDLLPFVQFKKRQKHPWKSVTFSTKSNTPPWVFSRFLNCTNGTKPRHVSHLLLEGSRYSKAWLPIVVARRLHASRQDTKIISLLKKLFYGKISLSPSLIFRRLIFDAIKNMFKIDKLTSEGKYLFEFIKKDKV